MERLSINTNDIVQENTERLAKLFPSAATEIIDDEGNSRIVIDFDTLRDLLGETAEGTRERYQFTWPGKQSSKEEARRVIDRTMRPSVDSSVNWDETGNLYIEGDNLEALKIMRNTYAGKIKFIYIDPPYNTGHDFIYDDDFALTHEEYDAENGDYDEDGGRLVANLTSNGRFHSDWCSMIYPRLLLARDLLSSDGVIFISIDDSEADNLKKICDEVFGHSNHVETFYMQVRYGQKSLNEKDDFQRVIEQVFLYAKNKQDFVPNKPYEDYDLSKFCNEITELAPGRNINLGGRVVTVFYPGEFKIEKHPTGRIGLLKDTWASGSVLKGNTSGKFFDQYLSGRKEIDGVGCLYKVPGIGDDGIGYRYFTGPKRENATKGQFYSGVPLTRIAEIESGGSRKYKPIVNFHDYSGAFGNIRHEGDVNFGAGKKPVVMLTELINIANLSDGDIVLDFFSGSASTAHAAMSYALQNGLQLSFIMVQVPETVNRDTDLGREGFETICEIGEERIRRAGAKIVAEVEEANRQLKLGEEPKPVPDVGFRVLRIDSSNFTDTYATPDGYAQDQLHLFEDNVKPDRSDLDLLFQVLPTLRIPYSAAIEEIEVCGKRAFDVNHGQLVACFDVEVGADCIEEIAKMRPIYAVFRDASMADDATEANFEELFKTFSPDTVRKVI